MRRRRVLVIVFSCAWSAAAVLAAPEPTDKELARLLGQDDSTEAQRRAAFARAKAAAPTKDLLREIERAWAACLRDLLKSAMAHKLQRDAQQVVPVLAQCGERMRTVVAAEAPPKEAVDKEIAAAQEPINAFHEKLLAVETYCDARTRFFEIGEYAAWAGVVRGFSESFGIALADLAFMQNFVAGKDQGVLEFNFSQAFSIDPPEAECMARTNLHRIRLGLRPLEFDLRLVAAGRKHSEEMAQRNYFAHDSPTPSLRTPWIRAARDSVSASAENIAQASSAKEALQMWIYSVGHHRNMLEPGVASIGIGSFRGNWTQLFGGASIRTSYRTIDALPYVRSRYEAGEDVRKLLALARWCLAHKLTTQAEDELDRVLRIAPANEEARALRASLRPPGK